MTLTVGVPPEIAASQEASLQNYEKRLAISKRLTDDLRMQRDASKAECKELQSIVASLTDELSTLKEAIPTKADEPVDARAHEALDLANDKLAESESRNTELSLHVQNLQGSLSSTQSELETATERLQQIEERFAAQVDKLDELETTLFQAKADLVKETSRADSQTDRADTADLEISTHKDKVAELNVQVQELLAALKKFEAEQTTLVAEKEQLCLNIEGLKTDLHAALEKARQSDEVANRYAAGSREASAEAEAFKALLSQKEAELCDIKTKLAVSNGDLEISRKSEQAAKRASEASSAEIDRQVVIAENMQNMHAKKIAKIEEQLGQALKAEQISREEIESLVQQQVSAMDKISMLEKNDKKYKLAHEEEVSKTKIIETKLKATEKKLKEATDKFEAAKKECSDHIANIKTLELIEKQTTAQIKAMQASESGKMMSVAGAVVVVVLVVLRAYGSRMFC